MEHNHGSNGSDTGMNVWCLMGDQFGHVKPVEEYFGPKARFTYDGVYDPRAMLAAAPDLVLCVNDFIYDISRCLEEARRAHIPSLVLQDGILEWRCQYENPLFGAGGGAPQHQPVLADKIACLGSQSARQIGAWGNASKVEVTGMPRLDPLLKRTPPRVRRPGIRILVMTAKKPGFTPEQTAVTVRSLRDVKAHLDTVPEIEVIWRLSKGLDQTLGVANRLKDDSGLELAALLETVDAVITTPSTALLEAMLMDRPVAALDYHNVPRFVQTAWTISAPGHIAEAVAELRKPPPRKMAFQRDCLNDCLACAGPAAPVVALLKEKMVAAAKADSGTALRLPPNLLGRAVPAPAGTPAKLSSLYPGQPAFEGEDIMEMQGRLARQQRRIEELEKVIRRRSIFYALYKAGQSLQNLLRRKTGTGK